MNVAKFLDDLLIGVKGQSRLVIASSPRNIFKYRINNVSLWCVVNIGFDLFNI